MGKSIFVTSKLLPYSILMALLGGPLVSSLMGQDYMYIRPVRGAPLSEFGISARYLLQPDVGFRGMGNIPFRENFEQFENPINNSASGVTYDDGYVRQDYRETELVGGGPANGDIVPTNDGSTGNFSYNRESQVVNGGNAIAYHLYSSSADNSVQFEGDSTSSVGWELNYTRFLSRKRSLGFQVGFSFNGFDSSFADEVEADLTIREYIHEMTSGTVPGLTETENSEGETETSPYTGSEIAKDGDPRVSETPTGDPVEDFLENGATVISDLELRSSMYNFRMGPLYNLDIGKKFSLRLGAGLSALYYSGRFAAMESLVNPTGDEPLARTSSTTEANEWQVGAYVDANAAYNITDRVSVFSGLQYQGGSAYTQQNAEREVDVDFSTQIYVQTGLGIRF